MAHYTAFISHSMVQEDIGIVYEACNHAAVSGINCYIAERDWQFGHSLPQKIKNRL